MRARGANVTDIAIIVVAADDGVMPQTAEAINHAKAAVYRSSLRSIKWTNPAPIRNESSNNSLSSNWFLRNGAEQRFFVLFQPLRRGIKELLEQIALVAEVAELKANPKRSATGTVIEARMEKGRGSVASLLIRDGTLKVGDLVVAGSVIGRVRNLRNDKDEQVKEVPRVTPSRS